MYNRYIPQNDGTYRRNMHQEATASAKRENTPPPPASEPQQNTHTDEPPMRSSWSESSAGSFLKNLLPKNLDTGDLLVIILLLLIAGDGSSDKNSALLTLAIYLFL